MNLSVAETKEIASLLKRKKDGLSAKDVVDFAKLPGSALHRRFEWDDAKAALGYRLEIARDILQSFKITVERKTEDEREVTFVVAPGAVSIGEGFRDVRLRDEGRDLRAGADRVRVAAHPNATRTPSVPLCPGW